MQVIGCGAVLVFHRFVEIFLGRYPEGVDKSMLTFVLYCAVRNPRLFLRTSTNDEQRERSTSSDLTRSSFGSLRTNSPPSPQPVTASCAPASLSLEQTPGVEIKLGPDGKMLKAPPGSTFRRARDLVFIPFSPPRRTILAPAFFCPTSGFVGHTSVAGSTASA
jgi:hypothetical protein